jgi:molybdenum cofactor cytidylyltransferase
MTHQPKTLSRTIQVAALVLAAGSSSRFGSDKRFSLLPHHHAKSVPMAVQSILNLTALDLEVFVVVKPEDPLPKYFQQFLELNWDYKPRANTVHWLASKDHAAGMGHSLSCGAQAVDQAGFDACLVALADMPFIQNNTFENLLQALKAGQSLVRPAYDGIPGHPVGFAREWFPKLISSTGDEGAKPWIKHLKHQIHTIDVNDSGVLKDIDQPSDLN